jgi:hypothetical protein
MFEPPQPGEWPPAALPVEPVGRVEVWSIRGADPADPDAWDSARMLRYYGGHELDQAIRDADAVQYTPAGVEVRVVDQMGHIWHRVYSAADRVAA